MRGLTSIVFLLICSAQLCAQQPRPRYELNRLQGCDALKPAAAALKRLQDSCRPFRVLHLGDSHVRSGFFAESMLDSLQGYRALQTHCADSAIKLMVLAKNGATSKHFPADVYDAAGVIAFAPDLVIISLGTNEAINDYREADLQHYFGELLALIRRDAPGAALLFTAPGDAQKKTGRRVKHKKHYRVETRFGPNSNLHLVVHFLQDFAAREGAAFWDWNAIMGGRDVIVRWSLSGLAKPDRVHLTEAGYRLQGTLLAAALLNCLQQ